MNDSVEASLGTGAVLVALVYPRDHHLVQPPELVAHVLPQLVVSVTASGGNGELPAGALVLVPAVVSAVAAGEELLISVEVDSRLGQADGAVLHVLREVPVDGVDAGDGHVLLAVAEVLDGAKLPAGLEFVIHVKPPVKVEEVNLEFRFCDTGKFQGNLKLKLKFLTCDKSQLTLNIGEPL